MEACAICYSTAISACERAKCRHAAKSGTLLYHGINTFKLPSVLAISACGMRRVGVEPAISYSTAISACEKASVCTYAYGSHERALDLLSSMRREGVEPIQ